MDLGTSELSISCRNCFSFTRSSILFIFQNKVSIFWLPSNVVRIQLQALTCAEGLNWTQTDTGRVSWLQLASKIYWLVRLWGYTRTRVPPSKVSWRDIWIFSLELFPHVVVTEQGVYRDNRKAYAAFMCGNTWRAFEWRSNMYGAAAWIEKANAIQHCLHRGVFFQLYISAELAHASTQVHKEKNKSFWIQFFLYSLFCFSITFVFDTFYHK